MKRPILLWTALLALAAPTAAAAAGLNLAWTRCAALGGTRNRAFACDSNLGSNVVVGTFVLPFDVAQVSGSEITLDLVSQQAVLPAWWELEFAGACRQASLVIAAYDGDGVTCADWSAGASTVVIASYVVNDPNAPYAGRPNAARLKCIGAVSPIYVTNLLGEHEYGDFQLTIDNRRTVGLPSCAGCANPVCIAFTRLTVTTLGNQNNVVLSGPTSRGSDTVTWQGDGADCAAVPVRNVTWGAVKVMYR